MRIRLGKEESLGYFFIFIFLIFDFMMTTNDKNVIKKVKKAKKGVTTITQKAQDPLFEVNQLKELQYLSTL